MPEPEERLIICRHRGARYWSPIPCLWLPNIYFRQPPLFMRTSMSASRNTSSGPDVPQRLVQSAFVGAVTVAILIPVFRTLFTQLAGIHQTLPSQGGQFSPHITTILATGDIALTLLPIVSTVGMALLAYSRIGGLGVGLYLLLCTAATGILAGNVSAVLTFVLGAVALTVIWTVTSTSRGRRTVPTRRY